MVDNALHGSVIVLLVDLTSEGLALRGPVWCSTYYSFCGNAAKAGSAATGRGVAGEIRSAVCNSWLKPIDMKEHPTFSAWVIYGVVP